MLDHFAPLGSKYGIFSILQTVTYTMKGLLKSENTVLQICLGLFTHSREFVQLCYKYDIDVALCSSGAIFSAVCSHFSQVVFSHL